MPTAAASQLSTSAGRTIRGICAYLDISVTELAERVGESRSGIWRKLKGETALGLADLERIAKVLDVDPYLILSRIERDRVELGRQLDNSGRVSRGDLARNIENAGF